jgi:hypothetical protein
VAGPRPSKIVALLVASALLVGGCGGGGSSKTSSNGSSKVSPTVYVQTVCTAVGSWVNSVKSRASALSANPPHGTTQGRQALQSFIGGVLTDTDKALSAVQAAGVPDVSNGQQISSAITGAFTQVKGVLTQAEQQANQLPTNSPSAFKTAATQLGSSVQQSLSNIGSSLSALKDPALTTAAQKTPACQTLKA